MIVFRAHEGDLDAIMELEETGFDHGRWSRESWNAELSAHDRQVLAYRDAEGALVAVATLQLLDDFADLLRVVVAPERRGQGIARRLLVASIHMAQAAGAQRILLEVEEDNVPARSVYVRLGFSPIDRRRDYYGPGRHALVMELPIDEDSYSPGSPVEVAS
ncbi:MAG TPA: GNAT family N-acetyltransferase [Propionibacteriaceae bacterium]|nr:GNAT family N-acetyltransferase [Propionibacteriaceae bacterium]